MTILDDAIKAVGNVTVSDSGVIGYAQRMNNISSDRLIRSLTEAAARVLCPREPSAETLGAIARGLCLSNESDWEKICEDEPFPRFWDGSLTTRTDYRKDALAAYRAQPLWAELWGDK